MILRLALSALMVLGLAGFGAVAWLSAHPPPAQRMAATSQRESHGVLQLTRDLRAGTLLKAEDLATRELAAGEPEPAQPVIPDSPESRRGLVGGMVRRSLSAGDLLHARDVMRPGDHGFLAAVLEPGMRAVTVGVDSVSGTAGLIWPGDRVDLILTQSIEDTALPPGRRVAAETVLQNTRVIAIDQQLVQGAVPGAAEAPAARTVTLEVNGEQAERVQVAARIGRLSLAVRAAEPSNAAGEAAPPPAVWAGDVSAALTATPPPAPNLLRVFHGAADGQELHF
jgi:pilus assembly protein CpaB